jgi:Uma2 family endonuclease
MNWQEVLEDKTLRDLPYKIELNKQGQIIMSPAKSRHSDLQGEIEHLLRTLRPDGRVLPECPIDTSDNVKVPDVVWLSRARYEQVKAQDVYQIAPEICVEVLSGSNTDEGMRRKMALYFEKSAVECWLCDNDGNMSFFIQSGKIEKSSLLPEFPTKINI